MTVAELLDRADSRELTEWSLLFGIHHEEHELRKDGLTEDEIAEAIEGRAEREQDSSLLDRLMTPEDAERARAEREQAHADRLLDELNEDDDPDDDDA